MIHSALRLAVRYSHIWALAEQITVSGVNTLTGTLLALYLGLEEFGRFTLAWDGSAVRQQYSPRHGHFADDEYRPLLPSTL